MINAQLDAQIDTAKGLLTRVKSAIIDRVAPDIVGTKFTTDMYGRQVECTVTGVRWGLGDEVLVEYKYVHPGTKKTRRGIY